MREETRQHILHGGRNDKLLDVWSAVHLVTGALMAWVMDPFWALALLVLYEPLEIFVLYPIVLRVTGKVFGYESFRNSLSDIVFDVAGVVIGYYGFRAWWDAPVTLFP